MGDPTGISAITSGLTTIIKICEITYALKAVKEQTTALLQTTNLVSRNIHEAKRLLHQKSALVRPGDKQWMLKTIGDAELALKGIAMLVEAARVNLQNSRGVDLKTKVVWVFRDNLKAGEKMSHLGICHQALMGVITCLHGKDIVVVTPVDPQVVDDARDRDEDDGLPSYSKSQLQNQFLHRKRSSRQMKNDKESDELKLPMLPPRPPKVPVKDDGFGVDGSGGAPLVTVTSLGSDYLSPSSSYGTGFQGDGFFGTETRSNSDFTDYNPDTTTAASPGPKRRRQWLTMQAARSNLGHLDP